MSRYYEMSVEVTGYDPEKEDGIKAVAAEEWNFEEWTHYADRPGMDDNEKGMMSSAKDNLSGGETEEQFAERLIVAIWKANGSYCTVTVDATYLESLPYETHTLDEDDYERLIQPNAGETKDEDHTDR